MIRRQNRLIAMLKPLSIVVLLLSIFSIVWLRSSIVSLEYNISNLEKKKTELMIQRKILTAERANLISVERFENAASNGLVFPDRIKVVHVKKAKEIEPYRVSFKEGLGEITK
jgi:cell division protein FtsL